MSDNDSMGDDEEYEYDEDEDYEMEDTEQYQYDVVSGGNPNAAPIGSPMGSSSKNGIVMLPADDLIPEMKRRLEDVCEILDIPPSAAAVLLREHHWSKEVLTEIFYQKSDELLKKCGVYARCNGKSQADAKLSTKQMKTRSKSKPTKNCPICYDDQESMLAMPCGHEFCVGCWRDFCTAAVKDEGPASVSVTCPQFDCKEVVTEEEFETALSDGDKDHEETLKKFHQFQLRSFVESNTLTRWCPGVGCNRVACAESASAVEAADHVAHCTVCTTSFCLTCGDEPHAPCACPELLQWKEKCRNESETANWILANTKCCPKCLSRIEKNQGCNHMTCQRCRYEFCWICMGDWTEHGSNTGGYYKCNKFDTANGSGGDDMTDAARAKRELDRYLHYYKRYHAHAEAQKFAKKQLKETEARMVLLQESTDDAKWSDVEFLRAANEQLVECRRVLKYTYVYAYYFGSNPPPADAGKSDGNSQSAGMSVGAQYKMQKERFEHHQEMLERFTETLSELSEKPLAEMDRTDVVNQTRVVDRFMKNILKYVEDGMEEV